MAADKTIADLMREDDDRLRRRFVHATRPKGPMTLDQAKALCERMAGVQPELPDRDAGHD